MKVAVVLTIAAVAASLLPACIVSTSFLLKDSDLDDAAPPSCCISNQMEFHMESRDSRAPFTSLVSLSYDYTNQLEATNITYLMADGSTRRTRLWVSGGMLYYLDEESGRCYSRPGSVQKTCVYTMAPNLRYTGAITLGDSNEHFGARIFQDAVGANATTRVVVTQGLCSLVSMWHRDGHGPGGDFVLNTYNTTQGIRDRSVFNVPTACDDSTGVSGIEAEEAAFLSLDMFCPVLSPCWIRNHL